jgi:hypothetical protein
MRNLPTEVPFMYITNDNKYIIKKKVTSEIIGKKTENENDKYHVSEYPVARKHLHSGTFESCCTYLEDNFGYDIFLFGVVKIDKNDNEKKVEYKDPIFVGTRINAVITAATIASDQFEYFVIREDGGEIIPPNKYISIIGA